MERFVDTKRLVKGFVFFEQIGVRKAFCELPLFLLMVRKKSVVWLERINTRCGISKVDRAFRKRLFRV